MDIVTLLLFFFLMSSLKTKQKELPVNFIHKTSGYLEYHFIKNQNFGAKMR